jgi:glycosyltransferase involved in cell wall biosynthesis
VLIISHDLVGERMAGPGIRYFHLARVLAQHLPTALAVPDGSTLGDHQPFQVVHYLSHDWSTLAPHVAAAESCLIPIAVASQLAQLGVPLPCVIIDGYNPLLPEWLALTQHIELASLQHQWQAGRQAATLPYTLGDFFICASERQRDWWLGILEASGRINPATFRADFSLRRLVDVVPFGLPATPLTPTRQVLKDIWPGIEPADKLLLWGGGLWSWLDPLTAIRALAIVWTTRQDVKLLFPGTKHPNPVVSDMSSVTQYARQLADELGLLNRAVFFGDWVPYADWPNVLAECTFALSLHFNTLETRLAFRTRIIDYIWAGLPIIATQGDATSELIADHGLGVVVAEQDIAGVAAAILQLAAEPPHSRDLAFAQARQLLTWERAAQPLIDFCRQPRRAADSHFPFPLPEPAAPPPPVIGKEDGVHVAEAEALQLRQEVTRLQELVQGYERGRMMRLLKRFERIINYLLRICYR